MTTIFAFDAATSNACCALVRDGEPIGASVSPTRLLLSQAAALMAQAGVEPAELDALVVGTGPGSFTSIRIALATARAFCFALELPAAGVSTLHAFAGGLPVIDAKRGEVFTPGPAVCRPEELEVAGLRLIGDGAVRYRELLEAAGAEVPADDDPVHLPVAARLVSHAGAFADAELLEPVYVRLTDAMAAR